MTPFVSLAIAMMAPQIDINIETAPFPLTDPRLVVGCATLETGLTLLGPASFGGISAMSLDGETLTMLSDAATVMVSPVTRNERGLITHIDRTSLTSLTDESGAALTKRDADSEAFILSGDQVVLGLEDPHRIDRFTVTGPAWQFDENILTLTDASLGRNRGFEALTRLHNGQLFALTEGLDQSGLAPVFIVTEDNQSPAASPRHYRPHAGMRVTDADTDPLSGDVFVLERGFHRFTGPKARLVRLPVDRLPGDTLLEGIEIARFNALHAIDNMEALDIARNTAGELVIHLMSDDNFSPHQRTVLIGLTIDETSSGCRP